MPNNFPKDELEPLPRDAREAFANYPFPHASDGFDARFWRELDARKNRYRGFVGMLRRLVEIEIEGIAVWRLGFSMIGGAAFCALGLAMLSMRALPNSLPAPTPASAPQVALSTDIPMNTRRFARELWDEILPQRPPTSGHKRQLIPKEVSCVSLKNGLA